MDDSKASTATGEISPAPQRGRVLVLDILRGFSLVSMVAYHAMYDLVYMFGLSVPWYPAMPGYLWQQSICWVFILVSGASLHFGRRPFRRGLTVLGCAMVLTVATLVAMPGQRVLFGVLHFMGLAMLLAAALRPALQKVPPPVGLALSFALFLFTKGVPAGFLGVADVPLFALPPALYSTPFLFPLGLPGPGFFSSDYFPLIPWFFLFLTGWFAWALFGARVPRSTKKGGPLAFLGRHTLPIYMLHQPLIYGILSLLALTGVFA